MKLRLFLFFIPMFALMVAGHVYLYRRLLRDIGASTRLRRFAIVLGSLFLAGLAFTRSRAAWPQPMMLAIALWLGAFLYLLLARLCLALVEALARPADEARRMALRRGLAAGSALIALPTAGYGVFRAYEPPEISEVPIALPGLPRTMSGFSIVQLSDIHIGPILRAAYLRDLVARANALKPNLVAITGDLVDGTPDEIGGLIALLRELRAPTYFITGNHDYYAGADDWADVLTGMGISVLRNRHVAIEGLDLIGVDDWGNRRTGRRDYDLDRAMLGRDPERASILLAHQPENFAAVAQARIGLQLSGHTHAGQLFPATLAARAIWGEQRAGYSRVGDTQVYVSRGCGFVGPPMRVGSPPEIVRITLV